MITKTEAKYIQTLYHKKNREQEQLFIVEGEKMVAELLQTQWPIEKLYCIENFSNAHHPKATLISEADLQRISGLTTPNKALAIAAMPQHKAIRINGLILALDGIQDPGNLGTIIRTADWFGIETIVCSVDTADCFNPKVVQATMGSIFRVAVHYQPLDAFFETYTAPVFIADLHGEPLKNTAPTKQACIVLGSEGKGVRLQLPQQSQTIGVHIPRKGQAESLNVGIAAGILMAHFCQ
ncbi:MAG: RNA methyltransferase [Bacteroidetes bacterium]|nr:MAG: RNA methyltransferase [Bacteroidota bacterium]